MPIAANLIEQLGVGGVAGFIVGYTAKKLANFAAVIIALFFVALQLLAYKGLIQVHWDLL